MATLSTNKNVMIAYKSYYNKNNNITKKNILQHLADDIRYGPISRIEKF